MFEELEEILIASDVVETTLKIVENIKSEVKERKISDPIAIKELLKEELIAILNSGNEKDDLDECSVLKLDTSPAVIVVVGVNGVGKTTSIGKIAANLKNRGKKVILAAADTFRAAAIEQLEIWAKRADAEIVKHTEGSDPAAVVYDAIQATKARKADVLICDTAGRLHTKKNLMEELKKIFRIIDRELPEASRETLLILDATTDKMLFHRQKSLVKWQIFQV